MNSTNPLQQANQGEDIDTHDIFGDDDIGELGDLIGATGGDGGGPDMANLDWGELFGAGDGIFGAPTVDQPVSPTSNRLNSKTNGVSSVSFS